MGSRGAFVKPAVLMAWVCIAIAAIWRIQFRTSDFGAVFLAALMLLICLAISRYVVGLPYISGPMMYLGLLGLFHLGLVVPWALFHYDISNVSWFAPSDISRVMSLIIYALVAYQFGILIALYARQSPKLALSTSPANLKAGDLLASGSALFFLGGLMFVFGLIGLDPTEYLQLRYSELFRLSAESDPRFFGTGIMLAAIGLSVAAAGASKRQFRFVFPMAGVWVLMLLYWGFRGPALLIGVVVCAVAVKKDVRFPRSFPWLIAGALLLLLPMIRVTREEPAAERSGAYSFRDVNLFDAPAEMGASIRPLMETVAVIGPANYWRGRTYWLGIREIVPNLALQWKSPDTESAEDLPPNLWITSISDPWLYKNYGGIGFSAVAEPYMNFGVAGIVVYFFLIAFLLVRLDQIALRNCYALAAWALVLGPLLWTTRNDSSNFFRPAVWGLLFVAGVRVISGGYRLIRRSSDGNKGSLDAVET